MAAHRCKRCRQRTLKQGPYPAPDHCLLCGRRWPPPRPPTRAERLEAEREASTGEGGLVGALQEAAGIAASWGRGFGGGRA